MPRLKAYFRAYIRRKHVRPWALISPIIILLIALPLLRPLRHPLPSQINDDEMSRWATVQALVEQQTFAIDQTQFIGTRQKIRVGEAWYSDQPPVMGLLLSGPYWLMHRAGYSFKENSYLIEYLLTLLAATVPAAAAAGMIYRMGRVFELTRPRRAALGLVVVLGSGLISYATVLNPYAPAAALVLLSAAILVQVSIANSPLRSGGYLISAGFFAALAAAIDPAAVVFTILFIAVILSLRWRWSLRIGGILMYCIGLVPPVLLHVALSLPVTGDGRLGLAPLPTRVRRVAPVTVVEAQPKTGDGDEDLISSPPTWSQVAWAFTDRLTAAFVGPHGLVSHFPVLVFGLIGVGTIMHRHWPSSTKVLAVVTIVGGAIIILRYVYLPVDWKWAMFGVRWYVVFMPLTLFWAGAWMRKHHHLAAWITAGVLLGFSIVIGLIGATDPMPREGYDRYTPAAALRTLVHPSVPMEMSELAGR